MGGSDIIDQAPMARRTVDGGQRQSPLSRARRHHSRRGQSLMPKPSEILVWINLPAQ